MALAERSGCRCDHYSNSTPAVTRKLFLIYVLFRRVASRNCVLVAYNAGCGPQCKVRFSLWLVQTVQPPIAYPPRSRNSYHPNTLSYSDQSPPPFPSHSLAYRSFNQPHHIDLPKSLVPEVKAAGNSCSAFRSVRIGEHTPDSPADGWRSQFRILIFHRKYANKHHSLERTPLSRPDRWMVISISLSLPTSLTSFLHPRVRHLLGR